MVNIQVQVQEDLVALLGVDAIRHLLQEELAYQRFKLLETDIQKSMQEATDVNWEMEFEQARMEAFQEYQQRRV